MKHLILPITLLILLLSCNKKQNPSPNLSNQTNTNKSAYGIYRGIFYYSTTLGGPTSPYSDTTNIWIRKDAYNQNWLGPIAPDSIPITMNTDNTFTLNPILLPDTSPSGNDKRYTYQGSGSISNGVMYLKFYTRSTDPSNRDPWEFTGTFKLIQQ
jgi:hypothetical protein